MHLDIFFGICENFRSASEKIRIGYNVLASDGSTENDRNAFVGSVDI
jgi:hypothetical protein